MAPLVPCKAIPASPRSSDCNEPRSFAAIRRIRFPLQGTAALLPPPVLGDPPPPLSVLGDPPPPSLLDGPLPPAPACGLDVPAGSPRPHASASGSAANMTFHFIVISPPNSRTFKPYARMRLLAVFDFHDSHDCSQPIGEAPAP